MARKEVVASLSEVIRKCFGPSSRVDLYGSSSCGMALPKSDLDVSVSGPINEEERWFDRLAPFLERWASAGTLQVIATSRIPVVKVVDPRFGFSVDITWSAHTGVEAVTLVKQWHAEMDRFQPLVLTVKTLLAQRNLNLPYTGGLGSFCVCVMVRHYLMSLRLAKHSGKTASKKILSEKSPLGPLLLGFLRYFGTRFGYATHAVLADGRLVSKRESGLEGRFVLVNPLEPFSNCAASAFRMAETSVMFSVVETQLREAVALDLTLPEAPFASVLSSVVWADASIDEARKKLRNALIAGVQAKTAAVASVVAAPASVQQENTAPASPLRDSRGKAPRKVFKIDFNDEPNMRLENRQNV